ncbi:MAG TPA: patatin-like protein, partial [Pyrinomonadaceae bacterium]|nr:patatin-like protein [Pyrinomonadaceae bacterium]
MSSPKAEYKQEIRFAVVMYGGVSLAIYINGITRELFHLVNSTAREEPGGKTAVPLDQLTPTQRVYRKLSYILANRQFRQQCQTQALEKADRKESFKVPDVPSDDTTIETRFVIDILSGTSAGGINAIFLAKALANDENIDQLKELWLNEGDIGLLLNDKRSVAGIGLKNQHPPLSLLNSRRMYLKLLKAFDAMKKPNAIENSNSRLLDDGELDLFITTTDISGMALPIRLSDSVVYERRHRNVFQFKYSSQEAADEERNDFVSANNPFLAFAARCTSSFPFAFEPMKLSDIDEVLDACPEYRAKTELRGTTENWQRFFNRNLLRAANNNITDRAFGDGGYLDNKPFSYAADTIARRQAPLPVDRKLIYIEPSPEHPEDDNPDSQVDALRNVKAALLDLPAYETIREDLQRLMERNNLITRVNYITDAIEQDLDDARLQRPTLKPDEWRQLDLAGMVQRFGIYYIPYRRLRLEAASDELARTVIRRLGLDEDSAQYIVVRALIHAWREKTYKDENVRASDDRLQLLAQQLSNITSASTTPQQLEEIEGQLRSWLQLNLSDAYRDSVAAITNAQPGMKSSAQVKTANQFLLDYDFKYWLRRLSFVRLKIDQLLQLHKVPVKEDGTLAATDKQKAILKRLNKYLAGRHYDQLSQDEKLKLKDVL